METGDGPEKYFHNLILPHIWIKTYPWVLVLEVMPARVHAHAGQLHGDHVWVDVELVLGLLLAHLASSWVLLLLRALALPHGGELHGDEAAT